MIAGFDLIEAEDKLHKASSDTEGTDNSYWGAFAGWDKTVDSYCCHLYYYKIDYSVAFAVMVAADLYYNCCRSYYK